MRIKITPGALLNLCVMEMTSPSAINPTGHVINQRGTGAPNLYANRSEPAAISNTPAKTRPLLLWFSVFILLVLFLMR